MKFGRHLRFLLPAIWMLLMYIMSNKPDLPSNSVQTVDFAMKKFAHVTEYFILNLLWYYALGVSGIIRGSLYSLAFAFSDEIHQLFVPGRTGRLRDVGIDFVGISLAALLVIKFNPWIEPYLFPTQSKRHKK